VWSPPFASALVFTSASDAIALCPPSTVPKSIVLDGAPPFLPGVFDIPFNWLWYTRPNSIAGQRDVHRPGGIGLIAVAIVQALALRIPGTGERIDSSTEGLRFTDAAIGRLLCRLGRYQ
jgi:hypothetical protein